MRFSTVFLFSVFSFAAMTLLGCAKKPTLAVEVVTPLVAGVEFTRVETTVTDLDSAGNGSGQAVTTTAHLGDQFFSGYGVASIANITPGRKLVHVQLLRDNGSVLVQRKVIVSVVTDYVATVQLTYECAHVDCSAAGTGMTALNQCVAGTCVSTACDPTNVATRSAYCPGVSFCTTAADCAPVDACATQKCMEGFCIPTPKVPGICAANEYCEPFMGCINTMIDPLADAGIDAGADAETDAGVDADTDAGMDATIDAGIDMGPPAPCATNNGGCAAHATCDDTTGVAVCTCQSGYDGDGMTCTDIDECMAGTDNCDAHALCMNTVGSFTCTCGPGYSGTGVTCVKPDVSLAGGGQHSCEVLDDTTVVCWGLNSSGQLGVQDLAPRYSPTTVVQAANTPLTGVVQVTAQTNTTCALTNIGTVFCWGDDVLGEVGNGLSGMATIDTPRQVGGSTPIINAVALSAGAQFECAILADKTVECWGNNRYGMLGDTSTTNRASPVLVGAAAHAVLSNVIGIATGTSHTCALFGDGNVSCWGFNNHGQFGDGTALSTTVLRKTPTLSGAGHVAAFETDPAVQIVAGLDFTCGLAQSGSVYCWGTNGNGELGAGSAAVTSNVALPVMNLSEVSNVYANAGGSFACARTRSNALYCWGKNDLGQLGNGTVNFSNVPVLVNEVTAAGSVGVGGTHVISLQTDHAMLAWGKNTQAQLGSGMATNYEPTPVSGTTLYGATQIALGGQHSCAIFGPDSKVACWGQNGVGQLGNGTSIGAYAPVVVPGLTGVRELALGALSSCALLNDGSVWCWGYNRYFQLGNGTMTNSLSPIQVTGLPTTQHIASGAWYVAALTDAGALYGWGYNGNRQLGFTGSAPTPVLITGLAGPFDAVACGNSHTCVLTHDHAVYCFGTNNAGELGNGAVGGLALASTATAVANIGTLADYPIAINATGSSGTDEATCARTLSGAVYCWGANLNGQLANGDTTNRSLATASTITNAAEVSLGLGFGCYRDTSNAVYCWGDDTLGELGNGTVSSTPTTSPGSAPVMVNASAVAASSFQASYHACAISAGKVSCWGAGLATGTGVASGSFATPTPIWSGWN